MLRPRLIVISCLLAAQAAQAAQAAWAEPENSAAAPAASAAATAVESESQQFARERLMEMAKFLASKNAFNVTLQVAYDAVQDNGQKIEFGEIREISLQRPSQLRIEERASNGGRDLMLFDGKRITVLNSDAAVYAQAPQPGDLDATVRYFVRDLQMRLPLAPMLMGQFAEELQRRVQSVEYVESTDVLGEPAHHIAARTANVDFQVWIADSERPLPLRIVINYLQENGQPQFRADFSKWDLAPRFAKDTFAFTPPSGAQQIVFATQLMPMSPGTSTGDKQNTGGQP